MCVGIAVMEETRCAGGEQGPGGGISERERVAMCPERSGGVNVVLPRVAARETVALPRDGVVSSLPRVEMSMGRGGYEGEGGIGRGKGNNVCCCRDDHCRPGGGRNWIPCHCPVPSDWGFCVW